MRGSENRSAAEPAVRLATCGSVSAALIRDGEQRSAQRLQPGDPAPPGERVVALLQLRRRRRVIAGEHRDATCLHLRPQLLHCGTRSDRGGALGERADPLGVLVGEKEVLGTGLAAHVDAAGLGLGDQDGCRGGADMNDVERAAGLLGEEDRARNRLDLDDRRTGREVVAHRRAALRPCPRRQAGGDRVALGVHGDRQAKPCGARMPS